MGTVVRTIAVALQIWTCRCSDCPEIEDEGSTVFKSATWVKRHVATGSVSLLDARGTFANHAKTAVHANWPSFSVGRPMTPAGGVLKSASDLKALFAALGVTPAKPVIVYGDWGQGWGEEGRIHWTLKFLGHPNAFILQGGLKTYLNLYPEEKDTSYASTPVAAGVSEWESGLLPMADILAKKEGLSDAFLIDVRTPGEHDGTKLGNDGQPVYNVARPGHAKGSVSFPFIDLFTETGCLLSCVEFKSKLSGLGWTEGTKLVSYCTGGIRSAFFWSLTSHCELNAAANYAGSMWEYAADSSLPMTTNGAIGDATSPAFPGGSLLLCLIGTHVLALSPA